jgi:iron complex outermembrane receptor protein
MDGPFRSCFVYRVLACVISLAGGPCWATDEPVQMQEIVVTAQKISENVRDVPISVSVVGASQLSEQHVSNTEELTRIVPNFSFSSNGNPGSNTLELRGISSSAGASTIGIYFDDVAITARYRGNFNVSQPEPYLLDINQVEVLRGPQGTLYGASSEGGLIKFRTNPIDLAQLSGSVAASLSDTKHGATNYSVSGVVNVPITEGLLGLRLGAATSYDDGYIDRYSPDTGQRIQSRVNDHRVDVARFGLEARPLDGLVIRPTVFYQRLSYGSSDTVTPGLGADSVNGRVSDSGADTMIVPSLTVDYDLGWSSLTSVTADYTRTAPFTFDGTAFNSIYIGQCMLDGQCGSPAVLDLQGRLSGSKISALPGPSADKFFERQVSQEFRLASKPYSGRGLPMTWVGGVYYVDSTSRSDDVEYVSMFNQTFSALYGAPTMNAIFGGPLPNNVIYGATRRFSEKQYSAFGDLSYYPMPALRLSVGARYLSAKQSLDRSAYGFFNGGTSSASDSSRDHASTPRISVNYAMTPQRAFDWERQIRRCRPRSA